MSFRLNTLTAIAIGSAAEFSIVEPLYIAAYDHNALHWDWVSIVLSQYVGDDGYAVLLPMLTIFYNNNLHQRCDLCVSKTSSK